MVDLSNLYENYTKEIEILDKEYLKNITNTKNKNQIQKDYKLKSKQLRKKYQEEYTKTLGSTNKKEISELKNLDFRLKKIEIEKAKEAQETEPKNTLGKILKITPINLTRTKKEEEKLKKLKSKFRKKIARKKFYREITPNWFSIFKIKSKFYFKRSYQSIKSFIENLILNTKEWTKETYKNIHEKLKATSGKVKKKLITLSRKFKKKKQEDGKEKTEDQKIAEKLMSK
jgi:hypothetical protein